MSFVSASTLRAPPSSNWPPTILEFLATAAPGSVLTANQFGLAVNGSILWTATTIVGLFTAYISPFNESVDNTSVSIEGAQCSDGSYIFIYSPNTWRASECRKLLKVNGRGERI